MQKKIAFRTKNQAERYTERIYISIQVAGIKDFKVILQLISCGVGIGEEKENNNKQCLENDVRLYWGCMYTFAKHPVKTWCGIRNNKPNV